MLLGLVAAIKGVNIVYVGITAVAQVLLALLWYGCFVKHLDRYYYAADKGVRRPEHAIQRYSPFLIVATTLAAAVLRSVAVLVIMATYRGSTLCDYQCAAVAVAVLFMGSMHRHFGNQRPIQLFITQAGYEVSAAMLVAVSCYGMATMGY